MPRSLLLESAENGTFGLIIGKFIQRASENGEGQPSSYLVLWEGEPEPRIEKHSKQYVAGSVSYAVQAVSDEWSKWAAENPREAFMEILAEESLIATDGKSSATSVSDSKLKRRWNSVMGSHRPVEDYDEIVKWLAAEKKVNGAIGVQLKLNAEPKKLFEHEGVSGWWDTDSVKSKKGSFDKVVGLMTPSFYDWHNELSKLETKAKDFKSYIEFCKRSESVLVEQSIEPNGNSSASKAFAQYLDSLFGSSREAALATLSLVWGHFGSLIIDVHGATEHLETISVADVRDSRSLSNLVRALMDSGQTSKMTPEQIVMVASISCDSNLAVNYRVELETALETVPSDLWVSLATANGKQISSILDFLGFHSDLGRRLLNKLASGDDGLFASDIFWSPLKSEVLNSEVLTLLSRPLMSESIRPFVVRALTECLNNSSLSSVALALENPMVSKTFDSETWANWISNALKNRAHDKGPLILSTLKSEEELSTLGSQVDVLEKQASLLRAENLAQSKELEISKSEVANLVLQIEQARVGMKASVDSQSDQQTRDLMRSLAKLLVTAGSLPDKVDPSVYLQMVQQVKAIGISPIGSVGESVAFDPTKHIAPPGTSVASGNQVTVLAPGFENKMPDVAEVIWKAQVVLR
jgi:hypothetical protein